MKSGSVALYGIINTCIKKKSVKMNFLRQVRLPYVPGLWSLLSVLDPGRLKGDALDTTHTHAHAHMHTPTHTHACTRTPVHSPRSRLGARARADSGSPGRPLLPLPLPCRGSSSASWAHGRPVGSARGRPPSAVSRGPAAEHQPLSGRAADPILRGQVALPRSCPPPGAGSRAAPQASAGHRPVRGRAGGIPFSPEAPAWCGP